MKLGVIIYSSDPETVWNAFRFTNFALAIGDGVRIFLIGKGVECVASESLDTEKFNISEQLQAVFKTGGGVFACGTCLESRHLQPPARFTVSTMKDLYEIVKESDKVVTF